MMHGGPATLHPAESGAVIMGVLGFCFRNLGGCFCPLLSVLCGVVWTWGSWS